MAPRSKQPDTAEPDVAVEGDPRDASEEPGFFIPSPDPAEVAATAAAADPDVPAVRVIDPENVALLPPPEIDYPDSVTYVGPFDAVQVVRPDGTRGTVTSGGTFNTTTAHADELRAQPTNWT